MIKKALIVVGIASGLQSVHAQKLVSNELPDRYFKEGKEMFVDGNYVGSQHSLEEFKKTAKDRDLIAEADFMILSSRFLTGKNVGTELKEYLDSHPETYHRNDICFYIGSTHYNAKEWKLALYWFDQANIDYLSPKDQEDYAFRFAFANLQEGNLQAAKGPFLQLARNSERYSETASYYLAYIDFKNGDYNTSLAVFDKLKNNPVFREEALSFLTQGSFLKGDYQRTISEGESYISAYPNSKNAPEIYRLLGNAYNQRGDVNRSIANYEKYLALETKPIREDMYLLGNTYYNVEAYQKATNALKYVASTEDELGQAAYLRLGQAYLKLNDNTNAIMAFEAASRVKYSPEVSEAALYNYALLIHKNAISVFDESVTVFQRFLKEYPNSKYRNSVNGILATTFLSTKNYSAALNAINQIQSPDRQILAAKQVVLYQLGAESFINSSYTQAMDYFNASIVMGDYDKKAKNEAYFWRAETYYRQGNYQQAANDYQTYISATTVADVNHVQAYYNLGYACFQLKQYAKASTNFQRYVSLEKNRASVTYADALNRVGDCLLFDRKFAEAEKYYSQAVNASPANADYAEYQKAFVLGMQRNYAGKVSALDAMMSKYKDSRYYADALFEKSKALVMMGKEREAIPVLEKLLREYPNHNIAREGAIQLGQAYFNLNDAQNSIKAYKWIAENYPNTEESRIAIQSLEGVYKDANDINSYVSYVNSLGGSVKITASRQDSLTYLAAENIYMKGQKVNAKTAMAKYLQSYPNGAFASDAHFHLGSIAYEAKDYNTALSELNKVIGLGKPKYLPDALIYVSGMQFDRKNYAEAYKAYEHLSIVAKDADSKNVGQLGMLRCASLLKKDGDVITAATVLINNTKTSPEVVNEARYYRGKSYLNQNKNDEALKDFKVLSKDTRTVFGAESQYILAENYLKAKNYDLAEKQVFELMKQGTPHEYWMAKSFLVLSDAYAGKGDVFQAKQYLESLQANYKGNEPDIASGIAERLAKLK